MGHFRKHCITFVVSSQCNLDCMYCYIPHWGSRVKAEDRVIDLDFAIAGMEDFFAWAPEPSIRYFSAGEATTAFGRMKEIQEAAGERASSRLKTELQTNGYFNEEIASWVEDNCNIVWISYDGAPNLQDSQRPTVGGRGSSKVVLKNIERFAKHPTMQFGIRATFLQENFDKQIETLEYFKSLGVKWVCGAPAYSSNVNAKVSVPLLLDFSHHFVPAFYHAQDIGMFYQTHLMLNFDEEVTCYCRACTTPICPQLTSDGYVSCCDWASFGPEYLNDVLQQCVYGKWDGEKKKIIYFEDRKARIEARNVDVLGEGDCKDCPVLKHCAGGCIGKVMVRSQDMHKMDRNWCDAVVYLAQHIPQNTGLYPVRHS